MTNTQQSPAEAELETIIQRAVSNGATRYVDGCKARIGEFVRRHYSFRGSLRIHTHAIGWDMVRMPLNIIWSVVNLLLAILGVTAGMVGLKRLQAWIRRVPPGLVTDMDRQISWLVVTELLQLPYEQGNKRSERDALMEEILKDPVLQQLLNNKLDAFQGPSRDRDFRDKLRTKLAEYGATRTGSADLASNITLLLTSKAMLGQASFGALSAGTAVSTAVAHSVAVSNFWLGSAVGAYYYAIVPVTVSIRMLVVTTVLVAVVMSLLSTFVGIVTDPIQAKLGLHQNRLNKLIGSIRADLQGTEHSRFELREKYMGRLFDIVDFLSVAGRTP